MNKKQLARFKRWFSRNVPAGFPHYEDPSELLNDLRRVDDRVRAGFWMNCRDDDVDPVKRFMYELVCNFSVPHIGPEELGPVLLDAAVSLTLGS